MSANIASNDSDTATMSTAQLDDEISSEDESLFITTNSIMKKKTEKAKWTAEEVRPFCCLKIGLFSDQYRG